MKIEKYQDLQLTSWTPRRAYGVRAALILKPKAGEDEWPSLKAVRQEESPLTHKRSKLLCAIRAFN